MPLTVGIARADSVRAADATQPITLTFEGFVGATNAILTLSEYGGLTWQNFGVLNGPRRPGSGYDVGTISRSSVALNLVGQPASVLGSGFTFEGGYFTAAWRTGLNLNIRAFSGMTEQFTAALTLNPFAPTLFAANWPGIDRLLFVSSGGIDVFPQRGSGTHFALDNFTFRPESAPPVPEPSTLLLLATSATWFARNGWKRRVSRHRWN
jgi:hypothetical protein